MKNIRGFLSESFNFLGEFFTYLHRRVFVMLTVQLHCFSFITKTCLYNFDTLKPHFYIVKLGFTGVYTIYHIFAQIHKLWVLFRTALASRF